MDVAATKLSDDEIQELLFAALAINDKLGTDDCGFATFSGSTNDVDDFRDTINHLWHRSCGWAKERKSMLRRDIEAAQSWYQRHEKAIRAAGIEDVPDFMVPF